MFLSINSDWVLFNEWESDSLWRICTVYAHVNFVVHCTSYNEVYNVHTVCTTLYTVQYTIYSVQCNSILNVYTAVSTLRCYISTVPESDYSMS